MVTVDELIRMAIRLSPAEKARLLQRVAASISQDLSAVETGEESWTEEELAELMRVEPLTGAEIVAAGLLGGWEDIQNGAEWVNEQKRKRRQKAKW